MDRKRVMLIAALICLAVFFLAPVIPRQVDVPCQGSTTASMHGTGWQSPSYATFGIGVSIPPPIACIV
ncbi:hypothetical protein E6H23_08450 [Candidatus Bathyarchaeota archaeon]|nr:MAG: hypothetical protein E6H23_08450 [Candidatus Bathyarchaeota archaeon]